MDINLSSEQEHAVELCAGEDPLVGITGRAGTGKTTILRHVYTEYLKQGIPVALAAPTGRAAKRIYEATGIKAVTIHKLLEFPLPSDDAVTIVGTPKTYTNGPKRNHHYPLDQKVILLDECSMLGPILYSQVRDAMKPHAQLRMFGDNKQLPPVEEGPPPFRSVLRNYPSVELSRNYRSDDEIIGNAELILRGRVPQRNARFEIFYTEDPIQTAIDVIDDGYANSDGQVITAMRNGTNGTLRLNPSLQIKFNGNHSIPQIKLNRLKDTETPITVKTRDKFLWTKNDYQFNLFNGDIGEIEHVDTESGELIIGLPDRPPLIIPPRAKAHGARGTYNYDPRKAIELGYAVTTHKAQGSEFNHVVYIMCSKGRSAAWMCSRNNFYTAVTRARMSVILITDRNAMHLSLRKVI